MVGKAGWKRGRLCETQGSAWDSEFKVRSCGGGKGGMQFALARRCSAPRGHLRKRRKPKMTMNAGPIRLKLGAGRPRNANRHRRTDVRSNSKTELRTQIYIRTPTTHRADFYYGQAGACGLRPHASSASRQANPRYARVRPKSASSLSLSIM